MQDVSPSTCARRVLTGSSTVAGDPLLLRSYPLVLLGPVPDREIMVISSTVPAYFLFASVFGAGAMILGLLTLLIERRVCSGRTLLGAVLVLLAGAVALAWTGGEAEIWLAIGALAGMVALLALLRSSWPERVLLAGSSLLRRPMVQGAVLLLGGSGLLIWQLARFDRFPEDDFLDNWMELERVIQLETVSEVQAQTDAGTPVPLYSAHLTLVGHSDADLDGHVIQRCRLERRVIQTAEASLESNCHGWVFAAGQHWVRGENVDQILKDNSYTLVSQPQVGDLVVYRYPNGQVSHTGLVRSVSDNGAILIESKWGQIGRFIHGPQDHCYAGHSYEYYRTNRGSHLLRGLREERPVPEVAPPPAGSRI